MTIDDATTLQLEWGDQLCGHPDIIAETQAAGIIHDNWRCTKCGGLVEYDGWRSSCDGRD
jgi:hypothetical protein